jgi:hypothetical protein
MIRIIYEPPADEPSTIIWGGRRFKANVPESIPDDAGYVIMETVASERPDGTIVRVPRERKVTYAEMARGNSYFRIEGEEKQVRKLPTEEEMCTPAEYRRYMQHWLKSETDLGRLRQRFEAEEDLREQCMMNDDDLRALRPFIDIRAVELKEAAKLARLQARGR